jgi:acyl-CoA thioester hydrolase
MYTKSFDIRWADLDANRHVANSSYVDMLSETRMSYMRENAFTQQHLEEFGIGPVIFAEEFYYIKEIKHGEKITVTLELLASSKDYKYIKLEHCIFNEENKLSIYSETFFGWFDLKERKLIAPPIELQTIYAGISKSDRYTVLPDQVNLKNNKIPFGKILRPME